MPPPQSTPDENTVRQFVYRQCRDSPREDLEECEGVTFRLVTGPQSLLGLGRPMLKRFGAAGLLKLALKLSTKKRRLYLFHTRDQIAHFGWLNIGFCNFYEVAEGEVTIGPIWSDKAMRGRGLATEGLKRAVNAMFEQGFQVFYIDTSEDNIPAQRAIAKAGFGEPIDYYAETADGWKLLDREPGGAPTDEGSL